MPILGIRNALPCDLRAPQSRDARIAAGWPERRRGALGSRAFFPEVHAARVESHGLPTDSVAPGSATFQAEMMIDGLVAGPRHGSSAERLLGQCEMRCCSQRTLLPSTVGRVVGDIDEPNAATICTSRSHHAHGVRPPSGSAQPQVHSPRCQSAGIT